MVSATFTLSFFSSLESSAKSDYTHKLDTKFKALADATDSSRDISVCGRCWDLNLDQSRSVIKSKRSERYDIFSQQAEMCNAFAELRRPDSGVPGIDEMRR